MPMRRSKKITIAALFLFTLTALGAGEAYMLRKQLAGSVTDTTPTTDLVVMRADGPDIASVLGANAEFTTQTTTEPTLLENIVPAGAAFDRIALLHNGQYAGVLAWTTSPDVKSMFVELKEALLPSFSSDVTGLSDQTFQEPGLPVRNVLAFKDPSLGPDAFVLIRVRNRLYEAHVAAGKEKEVEGLLTALSQ